VVLEKYRNKLGNDTQADADDILVMLDYRYFGSREFVIRCGYNLFCSSKQSTEMV
jgi:hypothetical protein